MAAPAGRTIAAALVAAASAAGSSADGATSWLTNATNRQATQTAELIRMSRMAAELLALILAAPRLRPQGQLAQSGGRSSSETPASAPSNQP